MSVVSFAVGPWILLFVIVIAQSIIVPCVKDPLKQAFLSQTLFMYAMGTLIVAMVASVIVVLQLVLSTE